MFWEIQPTIPDPLVDSFSHRVFHARRLITVFVLHFPLFLITYCLSLKSLQQPSVCPQLALCPIIHFPQGTEELFGSANLTHLILTCSQLLGNRLVTLTSSILKTNIIRGQTLNCEAFKIVVCRWGKQYVKQLKRITTKADESVFMRTNWTIIVEHDTIYNIVQWILVNKFIVKQWMPKIPLFV